MALWFWRRRFLNFVHVFLLFCNYLPLEKGKALHLNKIESPLLKNDLIAKLCWNWPSDSGEEFFLISSMYFPFFVIISPWKRVGPFNWTNLNHLHPRLLFAKYGWKWPSGSGEEDENVKSLWQRQWRQQRRQSQRSKRQKQQTTDKFWLEKIRWAKFA